MMKTTNSQQVDGGELQTIETNGGHLYRYFPEGGKAYITFNSLSEFFTWQDHAKANEQTIHKAPD